MRGLFPDQEQALYLTAVGLGLSMGAIGLFVTVFSPRHVFRQDATRRRYPPQLRDAAGHQNRNGTNILVRRM